MGCDMENVRGKLVQRSPEILGARCHHLFDPDFLPEPGGLKPSLNLPELAIDPNSVSVKRGR